VDTLDETSQSSPAGSQSRPAKVGHQPVESCVAVQSCETRKAAKRKQRVRRWSRHRRGPWRLQFGSLWHDRPPRSIWFVRRDQTEVRMVERRSVLMLGRQLAQKFGPLSDATETLLRKVSIEHLERWCDRDLTADSLDAVFDG
jgi:hypothetical protein